MSMLKERLQVLIDVEQRTRLETEAATRGTSVATLVREAIDLAFPPTRHRKSAASRVILGAEATDVPDSVDELVAELDELRGRRS